MEIKPWEDKLNTGIPLIDIQHKTLFDLINYFYLMEEDLDEEKVEFILKSIENYTLYHFSTEEKGDYTPFSLFSFISLFCSRCFSSLAIFFFFAFLDFLSGLLTSSNALQLHKTIFI